MKFHACVATLLLLGFPAMVASAQTTNSAPISTAPATDGKAAIVTVPGGTRVPVHIVGTLSSGSAKEGDVFQIQAADNVVVNGMIVIPSGAAGEGTVEKADRAAGNGHSGSLALRFDWISSADGGRIQLSSSDQTQAEEDRKGASSTATIIGFATLGIGGLFAHNFAHGKDLTIDEHRVLNAFVAQTIHVATAKTASQDARYDK